MSTPQHMKPPEFPRRLLQWFCDPYLIEDIEGDLTELFISRSAHNARKARRLFWMDVLLLFRPGIIKHFQFTDSQTNYSMFKNYFKIAVRNFMRYKEYSILNLSGLVVGITSAIMILLWINDEVNMDKFHSNGDHIYQLFRNMQQSSGITETTPSMPKPVGDLIKDAYSEVAQVSTMSWPIDLKMEYQENSTTEEGRYATPSFMNMFSFILIAGDQNTALNEINSIIISKSVALKYFGENWIDGAIGARFEIEDVFYGNTKDNAIVTGVFEDIGHNSSLQFDWIMPAQYYYTKNSWVDDWGNGSFNTFITIPDQSKVTAVANRVLDEINAHTVDNNKAGNEQVILHKFQDNYLYSNFDNGIVSGGRIGYVKIMVVVALFILIVACINFMNLTTARSNRRSREIGLRKVMGAQKQSIGIQFFFESSIFTGIAVAISLLFVILLFPYFNDLVGKALFIDFTSIQTWYFIIGITLIVALLSGSYPAILLPTFNIIQSLRGGIKQSALAAAIRKGLVVFQFAISMLLIIGTAVIYKQINYVLSKDLGLNRENVVAVTLQGDLSKRLKTYKTELSRIPGVKEVTAVSGNPINYSRSTSSADWEGKDPNEGYEVNVIMTDRDFIKTMDIALLHGRDFSAQIADSTNFIINEVAAELMGFDDPLHKKLSFMGIDGNIIGVVKNFHMRNLYEPIAPLIITCIDPGMSFLALIRIDQHAPESLASIEKVTKSLNPDFEFEYEFLDQAYAASYKNEETVSALVNIFAFISIFISCLGIYGLASYSAEQRSKEIGVRKVHGSSVNQILLLLSGDYMKLILLAFILAIPFAWYVSQSWLNNYQFSTHLDPFIFLLAGTIVFIIGVITVMAKSYHAATINPVNSLKDE